MTTLLYSLRQRRRICDILKLAMLVWLSGYTMSYGLNKPFREKLWLAGHSNWRIRDLLAQIELTTTQMLSWEISYAPASGSILLTLTCLFSLNATDKATFYLKLGRMIKQAG